MPSKRVSLKGKGADLFFGDYVPEQQPAPLPGDAPPPAAAPLPDDVPTAAPAELAPDYPVEAAPARPRRARQAATAASNGAPSPASKRASTLASTGASIEAIEAEAIESIRKVVKDPGREVSFVRLSLAEKTQLGDIVYTCKRQGQKTTENEINRIGLNYLLWDYREHGEQSVLARVLAALRA